MLKYHPDRYRLLRPFSKHAHRIFRETAGFGAPTEHTLLETQNRIFSYLQRDVATVPFSFRPADSRFYTSELSYFIKYGAFITFGKNIFDFGAGLVNQFKLTDVNEIPLSALTFPYDVFYMSFGKCDDLQLFGEYFVDGAYIERYDTPGLPLQITITTQHHNTDLSDPLSYIKQPDRYYYLSIDMDNPDMLLGQAMEIALQKNIAEAAKGVTNVTGQYTIDGRDVEVIDKSRRTSNRVIRDAQEAFDVFKEAMRLVVNGLCYLTAYMDDIETKWPEDTPGNLLKDLNSPKRSIVKKASAELKDRGYTKIHYCGKSFQRTSPKAKSDTNSKKATHWRRGHWRNQAVGPGRKERKLLWIMPVLINKEDKDPHGHIYLVDE